MHRMTFAVALLTACSTPVAPSAPDAAPVPDALGPYDHQVAAADVSILYPLPVGTRAGLIAATEVAAYGPFIPAGVAPAPLDIHGDVAADLRLIALRLDPCSARAGCASEVRAVFQPVVVRSGAVIAADGAVHVFYAVPPAELLGMLTEILALKKAYGSGVTYPDALGVQPILAATGLDGDFARGLHGVLRAHLGAQRVARVTVMQHLFPDSDAWGFALYERVGDQFVAHTISHTQSTSQLVFGEPADADVIGGIGGGSAATPTLPELAALADAGRPAQVTATLEAGFAEAIAAQDPRAHHSEDTDCASCHVAEGARRAGTDLYGLPVTGAFTSARSLAYVRASKALTNFHAFGYLGTAVSVMQRTANESAVVADAMEAALAPL